MFIAYIDESGKHHVTDPDKLFVLSAVIINENRWKKFNNRINILKSELLKSMNIIKNHYDDFEFHSHQMSSRKFPFNEISNLESLELFNRITDLLLVNRCTLVSIIIDKTKVKAENLTSEWVETWAWRLMGERLEKVAELKNIETSYPHKLMICMDNENKVQDKKISSLVSLFREEGSMVSNSKFIIENPFFVESIDSNFIQLADFVGWLTKQWYKHDIKPSKRSKKWVGYFDKLLPKFARGKEGYHMGAGIKIHP